MDFEAFQKQLFARRWLLLDQVLDVVVEAQEDLHELVHELPSADDRRRATELVEHLADTLPRSLEPRSRARMLAEQTLRKMFDGTRGREEMLTAVAAARKKVWEIAETAGDEKNAIQWMTRPLDCTERDLRDDTTPWSAEYESKYTPTVEERVNQRLWKTPPAAPDAD
jgi:hypothetical protein